MIPQCTEHTHAQQLWARFLFIFGLLFPNYLELDKKTIYTILGNCYFMEELPHLFSSLCLSFISPLSFFLYPLFFLFFLFPFSYLSYLLYISLFSLFLSLTILSPSLSPHSSLSPHFFFSRSSYPFKFVKFKAQAISRSIQGKVATGCSVAHSLY